MRITNVTRKTVMMKIRLLVIAASAIFTFFSCQTDEGEMLNTNLPGGKFSEIAGGIELAEQEKYKGYEENPFVKTSEEAVSTFSVDADGGSYANMRRFVNLGQKPPKESVRIEEYLNYFTFDYAEPQGDETVSLNSEIAKCPWNRAHCLMRVGMKGKTIPLSELPNSNYVFLIDVSGSMSSPDKLELLKTGFKTMVDNLRDRDRVAIVVYAGAAAVLLPSTYADDKNRIKKAIDKLGAGGSTAGAQGIKTAYEIATENFITGGNNRVILGSDGDFNVGISSTEELVKLIEEKRESGIYLTVLGVGSGNLNDYMMEQIANKGNGTYEYIDNVKQLQKIFTNEIGKFYVVAKDSKIQISFNKDKVQSYRLIGYENRKLDAKDFDDDKKDAGEIGSGQTITALYELVLHKDASSSKIAQFDFRYKKPETTKSRLLKHEIKGTTISINSATENMRFAASVVSFGLLMRESEYSGDATKGMVLDLGKAAVSYDQYGYKKEFLELVSNLNN